MGKKNLVGRCEVFSMSEAAGEIEAMSGSGNPTDIIPRNATVRLRRRNSDGTQTYFDELDKFELVFEWDGLPHAEPCLCCGGLHVDDCRES